MGTYTELVVDGYELIPSKSAVVPELMTVFQETDRKQLQQQRGGDPEEEVETIVRYECATRKIIDRLNVMGFTLGRAREEFEAGRLAEIAQWDDETDDWRPDELPLLKTMSFDAYLAAFGKIIRKRISPYEERKRQTPDPISRYILQQHDERRFGYFGEDWRLLLRAACEVARRESMVVQDISALIYSGYYGKTEPVCENVTKAILAQHPENSSRIILTEGSNDVHVLKAGLELLHPHLVGYYSFLDFDSSRSPGGAGHLVSLVKAFGGAGITNRIIALFDNDTAAHEAVNQLSKVPMPPNILVLHYPELPMLRKYPTIGPSGLVPLDVNGLAGSIELYFGADVLKNGKGFMPVQWRGYSEAMKKYQGEVTQKAHLLTVFNDRVARCREDTGLLGKTDWSGIDAILQRIFHAFDK